MIWLRCWQRRRSEPVTLEVMREGFKQAGIHSLVCRPEQHVGALLASPDCVPSARSQDAVLSRASSLNVRSPVACKPPGVPAWCWLSPLLLRQPMQ